MDQAAILQDYRALRIASVELSTKLVKSLSREDLDTGGKALEMLKDGKLFLENEDEISVLMDYVIHNVFHDGLNAVDRMLRDHSPPEGSLELRLLKSMQTSRCTLLDVEVAVPGFGVIVREGPGKNPIILVDAGLSSTASPGVALIARIHSPAEGWWMTTGAALPLNARAMDRIIADFEAYKQRFGGEPPEQERTTILIRACVASGASRQIEYRSFSHRRDRGAAAQPVMAGPKVGRNDPCPCGSGKKHKKCCGR
jgi:hypothetical protein